ncbi:quinolinate synthase NadA [Thermostichus vulcanus]|uniref:Quinolinate synthase n=1 Tax=Thermostichus vulcanus str. 'Rupite' TaxID=2813851 RepID=A0ABT0C9M4_THEVL|nr:quinolinate synthase NadA [Thermostichus vulcanus]MCJ2542399.1 quinolinate synthase NadA [Thermostichus vulcanus str. 'Rupite']
MTLLEQLEITQEIAKLKTEKNAVILAHNYQVPEVQDIADFVGDSLGLSQAAAQTDAEIIVFCGVHFMAETASILCPEQRVLLPDLEAGCSLAAMIDAEQLRQWKAEHSDAVVVSYVNTTAEVKAESDYCCTSANALKIIQAIPPEQEILFLPDMFLGAYLEKVTGRKMHIWPGECHVHAGIHPREIDAMHAIHPEAELLIHPECGCSTSCMYYQATGDSKGKVHILSTEGMIQHARRSLAKEFIVATEVGIVHRLQKEMTDKTFYPASERAICQYMKKITLEKVWISLQEEIYEVRVPEPTASKARRAIERMLALA